jgi:hypothetical protein
MTKSANAANRYAIPSPPNPELLAQSLDQVWSWESSGNPIRRCHVSSRSSKTSLMCKMSDLPPSYPTLPASHREIGGLNCNK